MSCPAGTAGDGGIGVGRPLTRTDGWKVAVPIMAERRGLDVTTPNVARIYDYWLGGKDNFAADREAAEKILTIVPEARVAARANRDFMGRAVRFLVRAGVRQFIDLGTGLPTQDNVHEVANRIDPGTRVV